MKTRTKYQLPNYYRLSSPVFDIHKLREELSRFEGLFSGVLQSNRELCSNNHELVASVYDHYEQVSLTVCNAKSASTLTLEQCQTLGQSAGREEQLSKHRKYAVKIGQRLDRPELDERNYNQPTREYQDSYFQHCVSQFKAPVMRVRLVKLKAGKSVDWHIDYDPTYATRIIVPIVTDPQVYNLTKRRGVIEKTHLPATGHCWFLNTGLSHSVMNESKIDRVVLMFSLASQEDIQEIEFNENAAQL